MSIYNQYHSEHSNKEKFQSNFKKNSNNQSIILLGDSILKNNSFVKQNAIEDILYERNDGNVLCLAKNDATIIDLYSQINEIPISWNLPNTTIFLSIGGNNILEKNINNSAHSDDSSSHDFSKYLNTIFGAYRNGIKTLKSKMNKSKIILVDIYYPKSIKYKQYHQIIQQWNEKIYQYSRDSKNGITGVLRISETLKNPEDFTFHIEPSEIGGEKIATNILNFPQ